LMSRPEPGLGPDAAATCREKGRCLATIRQKGVIIITLNFPVKLTFVNQTYLSGSIAVATHAPAEGLIPARSRRRGDDVLGDRHHCHPGSGVDSVSLNPSLTIVGVGLCQETRRAGRSYSSGQALSKT
jgi:hypothetical protein